MLLDIANAIMGWWMTLMLGMVLWTRFEWHKKTKGSALQNDIISTMILCGNMIMSMVIWLVIFPNQAFVHEGADPAFATFSMVMRFLFGMAGVYAMWAHWKLKNSSMTWKDVYLRVLIMTGPASLLGAYLTLFVFG